MPGQNFYNAIAQGNVENERLKQEKLKALYASQQAIAQKMSADADRKAASEEADKDRTFKGQQAQFEGGYKDKSFANALKIAETSAGTRKDVAEIGADARKYGADKGYQGRVESAQIGGDARRYGADKSAEASNYRTDATVTNQREGNLAAGERNDASLTSRENTARLLDSTRIALEEKKIANSQALQSAKADVQMKLGQLASADRQSAMQLRADLQNSQQRLKALELERKVMADPLMDETKASSIIGRAQSFGSAVSPSFNEGGETVPSAPPSSRPAVPQEDTDDEPVMKALMEPDEPAFGVMSSDRNTPSAATSAGVPVERSKDSTPTAAETAPSTGKYAKQLDKNKAQMGRNRDAVDNLALNFANNDIKSMQQRFMAEGLTPEQAAKEAAKQASAKVKEYNRLAIKQFNEQGAEQALSKPRVDPSSGATVTGPVVSDANNPNMTESMWGAESDGYVPKTWGNLPRRILKGTGESVVEGGKRAIDLGTGLHPLSLANMAAGGEGYGTNLSDLSKDIGQEQWAAGDVMNNDVFGGTYTDAPLKAAVSSGAELAMGKAGGAIAEKGLRGLAPALEKIPMLGGLLSKGAGMVDDAASQYVKPITDKMGEVLSRPLTDLSGKKAAAAAANQAGAVANAADEASLLKLEDKARRMQSVQDMSETVPSNPVNLPPSANNGDFAKAIRGEIDDTSAQMVDPLKPVAPIAPAPTGGPWQMNAPRKPMPEIDPNTGVKTLPLDGPTAQPGTLPMDIPTYPPDAVSKGAVQMVGPEASQVQRAAQLYQNPANYPDPMTYGDDFASAVTQKAPLNRGQMKPFEGPTVQPQGMQQQMQQAAPPMPPTKVLDPNRTMQMTESQIMGTDQPSFASALEEKAFNSGLPYKDKMSEMAGYQNSRLNFLPGTRIEVPDATIGVAPELEKLATQYGIAPDDLFGIINKIDSKFLPKVPFDTPEGAAEWMDVIWSSKGIDW